MSCASLSFSMVQKIYQVQKPSLSTVLAASTVVPDILIDMGLGYECIWQLTLFQNFNYSNYNSSINKKSIFISDHGYERKGVHYC